MTEAIITAIEATANKPQIGRGGNLESEAQAISRGQLDTTLIRVIRDAFLRQSEAEALVWTDVSVEPDGSGRLTLAMSTKTDQETAEPYTAYLARARYPNGYGLLPVPPASRTGIPGTAGAGE